MLMLWDKKAKYRDNHKQKQSAQKIQLIHFNKKILNFFEKKQVRS